MKMTSAFANKYLRSLEEDKSFWTNKESESYTYSVSMGEDPVIPDYDYQSVADTIDEIDRKICALKHAINIHNVNARIPVGGCIMSVDEILVRMAQLNKRKEVLDFMRKQQPKSRTNILVGRGNVPEYTYINYDLQLARSEYERISKQIMEMQIALDRYNQTEEFEVEL